MHLETMESVKNGYAEDNAWSSAGQLLSYKDQIIVIENGPKSDCVYESRLEYQSEQNFKESISLIPRMVPVKYKTTIIVDNCFEDSDEDNMKFYERIYFFPKMVATNYGSTVYNYSKEPKMTYETVYNYETNSKDKIFVSGITYPPVIDLGSSSVLHQNFEDAIIECNNNNDEKKDENYISSKELTIIKGIAVTCV